jgi:hypothetical protein
LYTNQTTTIKTNNDCKSYLVCEQIIHESISIVSVQEFHEASHQLRVVEFQLDSSPLLLVHRFGFHVGHAIVVELRTLLDDEEMARDGQLRDNFGFLTN